MKKKEMKNNGTLKIVGLYFKNIRLIKKNISKDLSDKKNNGKQTIENKILGHIRLHEIKLCKLVNLVMNVNSPGLKLSRPNIDGIINYKLGNIFPELENITKIIRTTNKLFSINGLIDAHISDVHELLNVYEIKHDYINRQLYI